jgi:predicted short-subunit dehydrogenase-like oxidoreductase (DUF2520 family)
MITLIGSGNVATWIAQRLQDNLRFPITQVYSRKLEHAQMLAEPLNAQAIDDIRQLNPDNQIFIFALADKAYDEILPKLPFRLSSAFLTSGTVSCQCLKDYADHYGVIYPLQTFTKTQDMRTLEVPLCLEYYDSQWATQEPTLPSVETNSSQDPTLPSVGNIQMHSLARELSPKCYEVSEEQRARMHVAAVFACNFSNAMYNIAYKLLEEKGLPFEILLPVLRQTVRKVGEMTPAEAQTGPAVRRDYNVMQKQLATLSDDRLKELYRLVSELIMNF